MKKTLLAILLAGLVASAATVTLSDTITSTVGGGNWTGRIVVSLNNPGLAQPLHASTLALAGWSATYCVGVTGSDCTTTTAAGVFSATLHANDAITPAGTSYTARFVPSKGVAWSETWVVTTGATKLSQVRATTVPSPTAMFAPGQISLGAGRLLYGSSTGVATTLAPGTNGQFLTLSGGYPTCATVSGGAWGTITGTLSAQTDLQSALDAKVAGASNLTTAGAIPYVSASGTLNQDPTALFWDAANDRATFGVAKIGTGLAGAAEFSVATSFGTSNFALLQTGTQTILNGSRIDFRIGNTDAMLVAPTTRNLLIGTTTDDGTNKLQVAGTAIVNLKAILKGSGASRSESAVIFSDSTGAEGSRRGAIGSEWFTTSGQYGLEFVTAGSLRGGIAYTSGNLIWGSSTYVDNGYKLDVAASGASGTLRVYDQTATTGSTKAVIRAGAGQSGNLQEWQDSAGAVLGFIGSTGSVEFPVGATYFRLMSGGSAYVNATDTSSGFQLHSGWGLKWGSSSATSSPDLSLSRASAGVLQVGDGAANANGSITAATFTGSLTGNASTATALAANGANCSAGQFPLGVDASGAAENCTALPTTISGTASEITASASTGAVTLSLPSSIDLGGKALEIPNSTSLPGTCTVGQIYMDTDATSGQRIYACESTNTWALQGGGGGATSVSGLTDLKVSVGSSTVLNIAAGTNVRGSAATAISAATATISAGSGSGTVLVYVTEGDVVTVEHPTAAGLTISCSGCTQQQVTTPAVPGNSRYLASVTVVSGAWTTATDKRGLSSRPITCGTGLTCTDTGGVLTTAIDTADVPRLGATNSFTGTVNVASGSFVQPGASGAPGAGACTSGTVGAAYINTANGGLAYDCMQTGASTYTWVSRGGSGASPGGSGTELQYRGGASTFSALSNSSVPNAGELAISTAPNASSTRAVFRLGNAITGADADGTYIGINHSTGSFAGNFLEFQDNGTRLITVGKDVSARIALRGNNYPTGAYEFYTAAGNHSYISGHHTAGILIGHNATTAVDTGYSVSFPREGGIMLRTPPGSKPTCDVNARGIIWHTYGGAGVKDSVETCAKDAADAYAWRTIY